MNDKQTKYKIAEGANFLNPYPFLALFSRINSALWLAIFQYLIKSIIFTAVVYSVSCDWGLYLSSLKCISTLHAILQGIT